MCQLYPNDGSIAVILKTGALDTRRIPSTLSTSLSCVKDNVVVLSDLEQHVEGLQVHDILSRYSQEAMEGNEEFDIYRKQLALKAEGRESELESLSTMLAPPRDWRTKGKSAGWALDKYKWLHMIDMAWDLNPNRLWYVFVETDTYLSWPNLKRWLQTFDPMKKHYMGLAIRKSDFREPYYFAQGGAGLVISGTAMYEFAVERRGLASSYDHRIKDWWAGDFLIADVLWDHMGLAVTQSIPLFSSQHPEGVPMYDRAFCQAAITMHHMKAHDFNHIFEHERALNFSRLLIRDVYEAVYPNGLPDRKDDWDNGADMREHGVETGRAKLQMDVDPNSGFDACQIACEKTEKCMQFTWRNFTADNGGSFDTMYSCVLGGAIRLGQPKAEQPFYTNEGDFNTYRRWHSGWLQQRISDWVEKNWACSQADEWKVGGWEDASGW
jgi:hypothetical protein